MDRAAEYLERAGLAQAANRLAGQLSGGMRQKLAVIASMLHQPELIVLDEPTTGVDPVSRREFWKLLSQFLASGITIIMSTPYLDEAERCARIALLHEGRVLALDQPGALRASLSGIVFEVMVTNPRDALDRLAKRAELGGVQVFGDRLHVSMARSDAAAAAEQLRVAMQHAGVASDSIRRIVPSLEDVFIHLLDSEDSNAAGPQTHEVHS